MSGDGSTQTQVRSIFLSDLHLGSPHAQVDLFLEALRTHEAEFVYLVGDFIDGWKLRRNWRWCSQSTKIVGMLMELAARGAQVHYTPGNHDEFLRYPEVAEGLSHLEMLKIRDEFIHETADGRRLLITHGDLYDGVERRSQWLSQLGSVGFELLLTIESAWAWLRGHKGSDRYNLSCAIKRHVKRATTAVGNFQQLLLQSAERNGCDGVVCGHIHTPALARVGQLTYCNTGDWVGSCTYVVERMDGRLDLMQHQIDRTDRLLATSPATVREGYADSSQPPPKEQIRAELSP